MQPEHVGDYFKLSKDEKELLQRFLFLDYLEEWEVATLKGYQYKIYDQMREQLKEMIRIQNYEVCGLYVDTMKRYKTDIEEFDSK
jgi:hypothetical protein